MRLRFEDGGCAIILPMGQPIGTDEGHGIVFDVLQLEFAVRSLPAEFFYSLLHVNTFPAYLGSKCRGLPGSMPRHFP